MLALHVPNLRVVRLVRWSLAGVSVRTGAHGAGEVYDAVSEAAHMGKAYEMRLDPPPADPRVAHPESTRPEAAKSGVTP